MGGRSPLRLRRPGYVSLNVTDVGRSRDFYTRVANLAVVEEDARTVYLRAHYEHHSLVLHASGRPGLDYLAFETLDDAQTEALRHHLAQRGVPLREAPEVAGRLGLAFQFQDPEGSWVEVYRAQPRRAGLISPGPFPLVDLGHFTLGARDVPGVAEFYRGVVGFRLSDQQGPALAFLRCNPAHHALAFLGVGQTFLHHVAFDVGSWEGIKGVLDWHARQQWAVGSGPVRHPQGNNIAVYVPDPDGTFVEYYCEMERIEDDEDHVRPDYLPFYDLWGRAGPPPYFHGVYPRDEHGRPRGEA